MPNKTTTGLDFFAKGEHWAIYLRIWEHRKTKGRHRRLGGELALTFACVSFTAAATTLISKVIEVIPRILSMMPLFP